MENDKQLLTFCKNIKALRKYYNFSKEKMSRLLGISVNSLTKIESCKVPKQLSCNILVYIYTFFGIGMAEIFTDISDRLIINHSAAAENLFKNIDFKPFS